MDDMIPLRLFTGLAFQDGVGWLDGRRTCIYGLVIL